MRPWLGAAPLAAILLLTAACHPSGFHWPSLGPSSQTREVNYAHCTGGGYEPGEALLWDQALGNWAAALTQTPMAPDFPGYPDCGIIEGQVTGEPIILLLYDFDNSVCGGQWTCVRFNFFQAAQGAQMVQAYYTDYWLAEPEPNEISHALRGFGWALGLAPHDHISCIASPFGGQYTIMALPVSPCPAWQEPQGADVISLVCEAYAYDGPFCEFNPPPPGAPAGGGGDSDGDGWTDDVDNCPAAANPLQEDRDIDGAGDACDGDDDGDAYADATEVYTTTDTLDNCPATGALNDELPDAWPPDFDDGQTINISDVLALKPRFGTSSGGPGYSARYDLNASGSINISDVLAMKPVFGSSCVSAASQQVDVIKATEQYRTLSAALGDGFEQATQHIPGRGAYYIRPDRLDTTFDLMEPEGLFYSPGPNGLRLMGVFYLYPAWLEPDPPVGFIGSSDVWSVHDDFCIAQGLVASEGTAQADCGTAGGVWWDQMGHFLPAWLFRYNPSGVFQETNPNVN